jgi:hypothetical protein
MAQEAVVSTGRPVQYQGLSLHQIGYLPRVQLQAWDRDGNPLALESGGEAQPGAARVEIRFLEDDEQPLVYMPAQERFLVLVFEPMCQQGQPALHVDWMDEDGGGRQRLVSLTSSGEVLAHDLRLRVELSYGPTLRLSRRPGMGLVPSGLSLAALVLLVGWLAPSQLISVMAEPQRGGGTCVQIAAPRGPRAPQWLQKLAVRLEEALGDDG